MSPSSPRVQARPVFRRGGRHHRCPVGGVVQGPGGFVRRRASSDAEAYAAVATLPDQSALPALLAHVTGLNLKIVSLTPGTPAARRRRRTMRSSTSLTLFPARHPIAAARGCLSGAVFRPGLRRWTGRRPTCLRFGHRAGVGAVRQDLPWDVGLDHLAEQAHPTWVPRGW